MVLIIVISILHSWEFAAVFPFNQSYILTETFSRGITFYLGSFRADQLSDKALSVSPHPNETQIECYNCNISGTGLFAYVYKSQ